MQSCLRRLRTCSIKRQRVHPNMQASHSQYPQLVDLDDDDEIELGVEEEKEDTESIHRPFDPEKIKVRTIQVLVSLLIARINHKEIELAPEFQRERGIWNKVRKSRLIESLLLRIPIPVFYVAADEEDRWSVVDGVQRISTVYDFVNNSFTMSNLEYLQKFEGMTYDDIPRQMQRRIDETEFVVNVIEPGTPREVMFNIFRRINTGGMPLNRQEIRHALYPGPVREFLKELSQTEEFLNATDHSIGTQRMSDRECVLRFLAFEIKPWEEYTEGDLDGFLGQAMASINSMDEDLRRNHARSFKLAMSAASGIFDGNAFRKPSDVTLGRRNPLNRALFEAWGVGLSRCSAEQVEKLVQCRILVKTDFEATMSNDPEFVASISSSTGDRRRVTKRFRTIDNLIRKYI